MKTEIPSDAYYLDGTPDGRIDALGEVEEYSFELTGGHSYAVFVNGASTGDGAFTLPDPVVVVIGPDGDPIAYQDDTSRDDTSLSDVLGRDPVLLFDASHTGTYNVGVADPFGGTGTFDLNLIELGQGFDPFSFAAIFHARPDHSGIG